MTVARTRSHILSPDETRRIIPDGDDALALRLGDRELRVTNLGKPYFPAAGLTKGDLLRYYLAVSPMLLPHLAERPMVLRRYPQGAEGESFFMKRAPEARPDWIRTCAVHHGSGSVIDYILVDDLATLLWVVNLGSIDLHPFYAQCDDPQRPDVLHFDLDPVERTPFERVREAALAVHEGLTRLGIPSYPKTTGSRGIHVYVPIVRGPTQETVWTFARELARLLEGEHPSLLTTEFRKAKRPRDRVLVDVNQNVWGHTLASVYSVRPRPRATVSMPVEWSEIAGGIETEAFDMTNAHERLDEVGDLWAPMLARSGRVDLWRFFGESSPPRRASPANTRQPRGRATARSG